MPLRSAAQSSGAESTDPRSDAIALATTIAILAAYNLARATWIPQGWHLVTGLLVLGALVIVALRAGLSRGELGLAADRLGAGLGWGTAAVGVALVVIAVGGVLASVVPALSGLLQDDRVDISGDQLLVETLVNTPFGTVALEEFAFRGVLLGLLLRRLGPWGATALSSALFGLWHVAPTLATATGNAGVADQAATGSGLAALVAGNVVVTALVGAGFCWLRLRSGSLLAPALAHLGINDGAFVAGWLTNR